MTIQDTRRRALRALIDSRFGGVQSKFGLAIGRQADYVSRLLSGRKALGERLAREIEGILILPAGSLDQEPVSPDRVEVAIGSLGAGRVPIIPWGPVVHLDHGRNPPSTNTAVNTAIDYAPLPPEVSPAAHARIVRGPAMEPEFVDGAIVYIDPAAAVEHGDFVVARPEGHATPMLRQLVIDGDRSWLRALNSAFPDPIIELTARGEILGRVVYQGKSYLRR